MPKIIKNKFALLTEVFEQAPSFMAVLSGKDHIFELANPAYYQLISYRETLGKPVRDSLPEVVSQGYIALLDSVYQTGTPYIGKEMPVQFQLDPTASIDEHYVDFVFQARRNNEGEIIGIFVYGVDVTDLVRAREMREKRAEQMREQAFTFDTALSNIPDIIYILDLEARFTYGNKPLFDVFNMPAHEVIGKTFSELPYTPELAETLSNYVAEVVKTGKQIQDVTRYVTPLGREGYFEYIFNPVFDEQGEVKLIAGSTRDITERVRLDQQKDEFLSMVSHELKTPVTSLKAYTQILQRRFIREGQDVAAEHLGKMDAQINKLVVLINDLLDVGKVTSGKVPFHESPFPLDEMINEAIEEVQRTTDQHHIQFDTLCNRTIIGDRDRIGQVVINLLTNAIKYSPDAETVLVTTNTDDASVTVSVRDFGIGISAEHLPHLFERFYRAEHHNTVSGLGLGLAIASDIILRHNGTIWAESELGQGTTFFFTLPALPTE